MCDIMSTFRDPYDSVHLTSRIVTDTHRILEDPEYETKAGGSSSGLNMLLHTATSIFSTFHADLIHNFACHRLC